MHLHLAKQTAWAYIDSVEAMDALGGLHYHDADWSRLQQARGYLAIHGSMGSRDIIDRLSDADEARKAWTPAGAR